MDDYMRQAKELIEYTRALRRDFHQHPELGFQEFRTAGVVARTLGELGIEVHIRFRLWPLAAERHREPAAICHSRVDSPARMWGPDWQSGASSRNAWLEGLCR